ncbi:MAG: hypothetical protein CMH50_07530 [Myxococcales bacterium]|nr:hypothetical protein [Myxococcales bacterium]
MIAGFGTRDRVNFLVFLEQERRSDSDPDFTAERALRASTRYTTHTMRLLCHLSLLFLLAACPQQGTESSLDGGRSPSADIGSQCSACSTDEICVEGQCRFSCPCPSGFRCVTDLGVCEPGCWGAEDCGDGEFCRDGRCDSTACTTPADCADGQICHQERCIEPECDIDSTCEASARCREQICVEIGEAACASADECGHGYQCSSYGLCFTGECLVHTDCEPDERCHSQVCLQRPTRPERILLERRFVAPLTEHYGAEPSGHFTGYGFGGGFFDLEGDGDLDIFLGTRERHATDVSPPCVYENRSIPSQMRFVAVPGECNPSPGQDISSAFGLDLDQDGAHELIVLGDGYAWLERFHPERSRTDLLALLPDGDVRRPHCNLGAATSMDVDYDGDFDVLLACQLNSYAIVAAEEIYRTGVQAYPLEGATYVGCAPDEDCAYRRRSMGLPNLAQTFFAQPGQEGLIDEGWDIMDLQVMRNFILYNEDGRLVYREDRDFEDPGATLAFGIVDMNNDGLLDVITANDSYMGLGMLKLAEHGDHLFIADEGPNRLVRFEGEEVINRVDEAGLKLSMSGNYHLESWGTVVDDFNRDGRDDLYVSQGMIPPLNQAAWAAHFDFLALQGETGRFTLYGAEVGVSDHNHLDARNETFVYSSRATVKADLDHDGYLDLLTVPFEGVIRIHSEVPLANVSGKRCTLRPINRYVPSYGYGYAIRSEGTGDWFRRDMQGQMRFGASPYVLTSFARGYLRFPSGAEIAFDCQNRTGTIDVEEPQWIRWEATENGHSLYMHMPWYGGGRPNVRVALRDVEGNTRIVSTVMDRTRFDFESRVEETRAMVQVDQRWIPRWFELPSR